MSLPLARFARVLVAVAVIAVAVSIVMVAVPETASAAESFNLYVYGGIYDSEGAIVVGASVVVKDVTAGKTYAAVLSDEFGQYDMYVPSSDWTNGDIIRIDVTYGVSTAYNQSVASNAFPMLKIDATLPEAIPEFGTTIGAGIAACLAGAVAIVAIGKPRKK